jgi:DNA-binding NarL/FixJ family response regulator
LELVIEEAFALWRTLASTSGPTGESTDGLARIQARRLFGAAQAYLRAVGTAPHQDRTPAATAGMALSPREVEVLRLLADGRSDREIAAALGVSHRTVTTHVAGIFNKLGVTSRTAAVARAIRSELV